jgi:sugar porter (SP) family MFS transporter
MSVVPETPRWLVATGREDKAREVLDGIADKDSAEAYINHLSRDAAALKRPNWRNLLQPYARPALIVGVTMAAIQQFVGINTIIYYAPKIMQQTGLSASNAILNSVAIGVLNVIMTIVAIRLVDRWGRKPLLYTSLIGMTASLVGLWAAFELSALSGAQSTLALIFILVYIASFAIGMGPIFWLLIAEVFSQDVRGEGAGASTTVNWLSNFAVSLTFPLLIAAIGEGWTFAIYAAVAVVAIAFVVRFVPETKDRSFEEIDAQLRRHGPTAPVEPATPDRAGRSGRPAHA